MKNINQISVKIFLAAFLCCTLGASAQNKIQKFKKAYKTNKDVSVNIDTRHTTIVFETWNKNEVEVEAFLETKDAKAQKEFLDKWKIDVNANGKEIRIQSAGVVGGHQMAMSSMPSMEGFAEMMGPLMENMRPMMESLNEQPPFPPQFYEKVGSLNFDYAAYERDGEAYMKKWEAEIEKKFGKEFEKDMEEWGKQFEKRAEKMAASMEKSMEAWGEKFGKEMEAWGEQFGQQMEAAMSGNGNVVVMNGTAANINDSKRTIIVRMPKDGTLNINVRHGEVQLADVTRNMRATLSHSRLVGGTIDGPQTMVNTSYAPVMVKNWNYGVLNMKYVKNCTLENVRSIKLGSNSSNVVINNLSETGILSGTFGNLTIHRLAPKFETLQINLENSNLVLQLPDAPLNFSYNGSQSRIKYPSGLQAKPVRSYDNELLNGFYKSNNADNSISIKAKYSEVLVK